MRLKGVLRHPKVLSILAWILAQYIKLVFWTTRWQRVGEEAFKEQGRKGPFIVCFWHNRLLMTTFAWVIPDRTFHMLISAHPDGRLIAQAVGHHGIQTIPGSKSKGGSEALRKILKVLKEKNVVGVTPDGPRGPRFKASEGIIHMARMAGVDIVPLSYSTSRRVILKSWDRFVLALPFGRGALVWGEAISLPQEMDKKEVETYRQLVEQKLQEVSAYADHLCGHSPLEE